MRWLVGDIHGCSRTFDALLREIRFDVNRDRLWCLGDLVHKGPDSLGVLRRWAELDGRSVVGNHDAKVLRHWRERDPQGKPDLARLFAAPDAVRLLERIAAEPLLTRLPDGPADESIWLVHAGIRPDWSNLAEAERRLHEGDRRDPAWWLDESRVFAMNARCCLRDGSRVRFTGAPGECPGDSEPWDRWYRGSATIVHGHWAIRGGHRTGRVIGLDGGCVYGGELVAWTPDDDRVVRIPLRDEIEEAAT